MSGSVVERLREIADSRSLEVEDRALIYESLPKLLGAVEAAKRMSEARHRKQAQWAHLARMLDEALRALYADPDSQQAEGE